MKKSDEQRQKLKSIAQFRRNLAKQKLEEDERKREEMKNKEILERRATFQKFKAKNMFSTAAKFIAGTQQKVIAWFEPGEDSNVFDQVAKDFEKPYPEVLTLQPGDMVTVYKKGLGLISHGWCSGEIFGHRGIFPQDILDATDVHAQMHQRSAEIAMKKQMLENEKDELEWEKEQEYMKECTFIPNIRKTNMNVYITLPVVRDFTREDLARFNNEFNSDEHVPLIVLTGQMVKILKKGLGTSKNWYYAQTRDKLNHKGYLPYRCIDHHGHTHTMHALDRKKAIEISKLRSEKAEAESQIYTFQPKINKRRQEMYLPADYKRARRLREEKRRLRELKEANKELTFQPNIYRPTRAKIDTNVRIIPDPTQIEKTIDVYEELFGEPKAKRVEPSHIKDRLKERTNLGLKKAFVTKNFKFSRPGAAVEVLIADFGLKHPVPLELYVGDKVTVLEHGVGNNGKWTLGHLGNITGVFPTTCIKPNRNNKKNNNNKNSHNSNKSHNMKINNSNTKKFAGNNGNSNNSTIIKMKKRGSKKKKLSVTFGESKTNNSNDVTASRPLHKNKNARKHGVMKQSPKRKFLTKKESPIKLSKKDPLWPGGGDGFDVNKKPSQSSLVSPVGQPISLTGKENKKLLSLRKRVKELLEKLPTLHSNTDQSLYRSDFTQWLVKNNLIEDESRRIVDSFFERIAAKGTDNISFRDISRSLHDIKIKSSRGRNSKRQFSSWL